MFDTLKTKFYHGKEFIKDIENAPMREQFRGFPAFDKTKDKTLLKDVCPTGAINLEPLSVDMGKCTFCGKCARLNSCISFTNGYKLASTSREKLVITPDMTYEDYVKNAVEIKKEITSLFNRSLKLRQVSAGGCNGCEMELNACSNVNFDMGRFGIDFVASPRHADGLVITGPITKNMANALEDCYKSTPSPKILILTGACAISGGIFAESDDIDRTFLQNHKIDLYIPGCPTHPLSFINGILSYIRGIK